MSGQTKLLVALGGAAVLAVLIVAALIIFGGDEEPLEQRPASAEPASADPPPADRDEAAPFATPNSTSFEENNAGRADASSGPTHGRARKSV